MNILIVFRILKRRLFEMAKMLQQLNIFLSWIITQETVYRCFQSRGRSMKIGWMCIVFFLCKFRKWLWIFSWIINENISMSSPLELQGEVHVIRFFSFPFIFGEKIVFLSYLFSFWEKHRFPSWRQRLHFVVASSTSHLMILTTHQHDVLLNLFRKKVSKKASTLTSFIWMKNPLRLSIHFHVDTKAIKQTLRTYRIHLKVFVSLVCSCTGRYVCGINYFGRIVPDNTFYFAPFISYSHRKFVSFFHSAYGKNYSFSTRFKMRSKLAIIWWEKNCIWLRFAHVL